MGEFREIAGGGNGWSRWWKWDFDIASRRVLSWRILFWFPGQMKAGCVLEGWGSVYSFIKWKGKLIILQLFQSPGKVRTLSFQPFFLEVAQGFGEHTEGRGQPSPVADTLCGTGAEANKISVMLNYWICAAQPRCCSPDLWWGVFLYPCLLIPTLVSSSQLWLMSFLPFLFVMIK